MKVGDKIAWHREVPGMTDRLKHLGATGGQTACRNDPLSWQDVDWMIASVLFASKCSWRSNHVEADHLAAQ